MSENSWLSRYRNPALIVAVLLVLAALGQIARFLVTPPEFPPGRDVDVEPPVLVAPGAASWDFEQAAIMYAARDGRVEVRTTYTPIDGGPRVRSYRESVPFLWPHHRPDRVAALLVFDGNEPWTDACRRILDRTPDFALESVYLAGLEDDGSLGGVPLYTARSKEMFEAFVTSRYHLYLTDITDDPIYEIEVRRRGGRVRYRWGHEPESSGLGPGDGGEVVLDAAAVSRGDVGALAPLSEFFGGVRRTSACPRFVILMADASARYVDVLRLVESVDAGPDLWILPCPGPGSLAYLMEIVDFELIVPAPLPWDLGRDERCGGPKHIFNLLWQDDPHGPPGTVIVRRRHVGLGDIDSVIDENPKAEVVVRAEERTAWTSCRAVIRAARRRGCRLFISYAPPPGLRHCRELSIPRPAPGSTVVDAEIVTTPAGESALAMPVLPSGGAAVRLRIPDGARAGPVLRLVAQLRAKGAQIVLD
jgi:hypothetical protein